MIGDKGMKGKRIPCDEKLVKFPSSAPRHSKAIDFLLKKSRLDCSKGISRIDRSTTWDSEMISRKKVLKWRSIQLHEPFTHKQLLMNWVGWRFIWKWRSWAKGKRRFHSLLSFVNKRNYDFLLRKLFSRVRQWRGNKKNSFGNKKNFVYLFHCLTHNDLVELTWKVLIFPEQKFRFPSQTRMC